MPKRLLFSVTAKDLEMQTFRCGGKGGQNVNKVESGVRFIHAASGARGESCTHRTQGKNKVEAFKRLAASQTFQAWHRLRTAQLTGEIDRAVNEGMHPRNLKVEYYGYHETIPNG